MTGLSKSYRCVCIIIISLAFGCAEIPQVKSTGSLLFNDNLFKAGKHEFEPQSVFKLSPAMLTYLNNEVLDDRHSHNAAQTLFNALYNKQQLKLEYDSSYTRTAREAFDAKSGNCLSLVLMTAAFAKQIGLGVRYQSVYTSENISRDENTIYYSGHLNLVLGKAGVYQGGENIDNAAMVIDFLTPTETGNQRAIAIVEQTVLSMYMNNRAAEELQMQRLDSAYWWAKQAIVNDPTFLASYNTLGVIYERHGNLPEAQQALRYVLEMDPVNHAALDNLSHVELKLGNKEESERLQKMLRQMVPTPPFYYFDLGIAAMKTKNYNLARDNFTQELRRSAYDPVFNFWLAAAYIGLDDASKARKHLIIAKENATTTKDRELYSQKLIELQLPHKN